MDVEPRHPSRRPDARFFIVDRSVHRPTCACPAGQWQLGLAVRQTSR
jgi:hypothetical protein